MTDFSKIIFGVHSNAVTEGQQGEEPHSWVSIDKNGEVSTYGSWPSTNDCVNDYGQEGGFNEQGTDVQKNIEITAELQAAHSHYTELTPQQQEVLDQKLNESHAWTRHDNCASWASHVASEVTGEKISATDTVKALHEDGYIVEIEVDSAKGISKSIQELEQQKEQGVNDKGIVPEQENPDLSQSPKGINQEVDARAVNSNDVSEKPNIAPREIEVKDSSVDLTPEKENSSYETDLGRAANNDINQDKIEQLDKINPERDAAIAELQEAREYAKAIEERQVTQNREHEGR